MAPLPHNAPIGVYVHVPFCAHICPYCDFNTYAGQNHLIEPYVAAVISDISAEAERIRRRDVCSIFFGGGTPSLVPADGIAAIVSTVRERFAIQPGAEVTLEANPNGLTFEYLTGLRASGVNRLSIGLQTTNRRGLRTLGRQHEAIDAERAVQLAVEAGFERISLDLIFGWPGQTAESWQHDIEAVLGWSDGAVEHLSLYSLIVEPGTPMADAVKRGILSPLDDDAAADLYEIAMEQLGTADYQHYEVANWARSDSAVSVHNRVYWRNGEYLGVGAGAHGRIGDVRTMRHLLPATYISAIERGESVVSNSEVLSEEVQRSETMMLGLRLIRQGVTFADFERRHGASLDDVFGLQIESLTRNGLLIRDERGVRLSDRGLLLANDVCAEFVGQPTYS